MRSPRLVTVAENVCQNERLKILADSRDKGMDDFARERNTATANDLAAILAKFSHETDLSGSTAEEALADAFRRDDERFNPRMATINAGCGLLCDRTHIFALMTLISSSDSEERTMHFANSPTPSTLGHQEVEALTRYLRLRWGMPGLQQLQSSQYNTGINANSHVVVRPQVDRISAVWTARKTFRPAVINGRPPADPMSSIRCNGATFEMRMSRHILLSAERVRGKAGVILQLFRHRLTFANGGYHDGHYVLVRCLVPTQGSDLFGFEIVSRCLPIVEIRQPA